MHSRQFEPPWFEVVLGVGIKRQQRAERCLRVVAAKNLPNERKRIRGKGCCWPGEDDKEWRKAKTRRIRRELKGKKVHKTREFYNFFSLLFSSPFIPVPSHPSIQIRIEMSLLGHYLDEFELVLVIDHEVTPQQLKAIAPFLGIQASSSAATTVASRAACIHHVLERSFHVIDHGPIHPPLLRPIKVQSVEVRLKLRVAQLVAFFVLPVAVGSGVLALNAVIGQMHKGVLQALGAQRIGGARGAQITLLVKPALHVPRAGMGHQQHEDANVELPTVDLVGWVRRRNGCSTWGKVNGKGSSFCPNSVCTFSPFSLRYRK